MSKLIPTYIEQALRIEQLERELAEAKAEIVRLKGEAESWEKVFDRTCEHLADAKEQLRLCNVGKKEWVYLTEQDVATIKKNAITMEWAILMADTTAKEKNT